MMKTCPFEGGAAIAYVRVLALGLLPSKTSKYRLELRSETDFPKAASSVMGATPTEICADSLLPATKTLMVYQALSAGTVGIPESTPDRRSKLRPAGRSGAISYQMAGPAGPKRIGTIGTP